MKEELIGLKEIEEVIVHCGDCGIGLLEVVLTETNEDRRKRNKPPIKNQFKVKCYKCGGFSFNTKVFEGTTVIGSLCDDIKFDMSEVDVVSDANGEDIIFTTLECRR